MPNIIINPEALNETQNGSLFMQPKTGLLDSINRTHPEIHGLYRYMRSLDWDEEEFDFSSCLLDFQMCSPDTYDAMIKTLAWQWEADSVAAYNLTTILQPFVSNTDLWSAYVAVGANEGLHGLTYANIVSNSFENPHQILAEVLAEREALYRLDNVGQVFRRMYTISHKYALNPDFAPTQYVYDQLLLFICTLYILERIQFVSSFGTTFAICDSGIFNPIGKAVQKIFNDEMQVHVELGRAVLRNEFRTEMGRGFIERQRDTLMALISESVDAEFRWNRYVLPEGKELVGLNYRLLDRLNIWSATEVYDFFGLDNPHEPIRELPLRYMRDWMASDKMQASPQEERNGNYLISPVIKTLTPDTVLEINFL